MPARKVGAHITLQSSQSPDQRLHKSPTYCCLLYKQEIQLNSVTSALLQQSNFGSHCQSNRL